MLRFKAFELPSPLPCYYNVITDRKELEMLRLVIKRLKIVVLHLGAIEYHRLANRACDTLRMHTARELRDIGIGDRGSIRSMAHRKCPKCHPKVRAEWLDDV